MLCLSSISNHQSQMLFSVKNKIKLIFPIYILMLQAKTRQIANGRKNITIDSQVVGGWQKHPIRICSSFLLFLKQQQQHALFLIPQWAIANSNVQKFKKRKLLCTLLNFVYFLSNVTTVRTLKIALAISRILWFRIIQFTFQTKNYLKPNCPVK